MVILILGYYAELLIIIYVNYNLFWFNLVGKSDENKFHLKWTVRLLHLFSTFINFDYILIAFPLPITLSISGKFSRLKNKFYLWKNISSMKTSGLECICHCLKAALKVLNLPKLLALHCLPVMSFPLLTLIDNYSSKLIRAQEFAQLL